MALYRLMQTDTMMITVEEVRIAPTLGHDFDRLFREEGPGIWRTIYAFTGGRRDVAEEAVAEAFARAIPRRGDPHDHVAFGGPSVRILPGGSAYITGNLGRVKDAEVVQGTFETGQTEWDGLWHVVLNDRVIGVVDFQSLDGVACRGSGFAGA